MSLETLRVAIDEADKELVQAFEKRMQIVEDIAKLKKEQGMQTIDKKRENEKIKALHEMTKPALWQSVDVLYDTIFELSKNYQNSLKEEHSPLYKEVEEALEQTQKLFPQSATVACQGVEGAYSERATSRLFKHPSVLYFKTFESVFSAIESGLCQYGVLPLENSTAGSVNRVYDLMMNHNFKIVKSVRFKVEHSLLVPNGVKKEDIKEIFSHEQAISQCASFLEQFGPEVKITRMENTAAAAEAVSNSERRDVAAIASHSCTYLYNLTCLERDIQDTSNNYTRFICISKNLEVYPGADRTSIMMVLPHKPGALHKVLSRFTALGLNLIKLESRPIPERDFEFMFYFDLESSVYATEFASLIDNLKDICEDFRYLGSYSEVI